MPPCSLSRADEDLAAMYLTDKKSAHKRQISDHEELEVLLESFSKQVEEIVTESESAMVCSRMSCYSVCSPDAYEEQRYSHSRNR